MRIKYVKYIYKQYVHTRCVKSTEHHCRYQRYYWWTGTGEKGEGLPLSRKCESLKTPPPDLSSQRWPWTSGDARVPFLFSSGLLCFVFVLK